ncbi:cytidylyltransferase domain-containing protein [Candidatus Omnitrophota bacterium]
MDKMKEKMVALVPVREGSTRIKDKNFIPFDNHPTLVHNKIQQLKDADCFHHIYISSDSRKAREIADACGVEYLERDPFMCTSKPRWDAVVESILNTVPGNPHVAWAMVTSPLFTRYKDAVEQYFSHIEEHDSLVGVKQIREYLIDEKGRPLFYSFGAWHPYSNELKPLYAINDVVFIARKSDQLRWRYWIGRKPHLFLCDSKESIDVNFQEDLDMAILAQQLKNKKTVPSAMER